MLAEMRRLTLFHRLLVNRCGATAIEYAIVAGLIAVAIVLAVTGIGIRLNVIFTTVQGGFR